MTAGKPLQPIRCSPDVLGLAPEMAILRLVDEALEAACFALIAEHPTLISEAVAVPGDPPTLRLARRLLQRAADIQRLLHRYAAAVDDATRPLDCSSELPF